MNKLLTFVAATALSAGVALAGDYDELPVVDLYSDYINTDNLPQISWTQLRGNIVDVLMYDGVPHLLVIETDIGLFKFDARDDYDYKVGQPFVINMSMHGM